MFVAFARKIIQCDVASSIKHVNKYPNKISHTGIYKLYKYLQWCLYSFQYNLLNYSQVCYPQLLPSQIQAHIFQNTEMHQKTVKITETVI